MSLKSQDGQIVNSPVLGGGTAAPNQPNTPLRMPPIPKGKHGGNYSLQRPLPKDHAMSKNAIPTQGGGRAAPNLIWINEYNEFST